MKVNNTAIYLTNFRRSDTASSAHHVAGRSGVPRGRPGFLT